MTMGARFSRWMSRASLIGALMAAASCGSTGTTATSPTSLTRCAVTLNGTNNVPAQGGTGTVTVTAARECSWTASVEGAWLAIKSGANGQGDGAVEFAASANPDPATRRGAIVLNDQRVDVVQGAAECTITLAENSSSFPQAGGSGRVDVRASSSLCTWTARPDENWIVLRSEANGKGSAPVLFDVAATTGPPRTGGITIAGQRFNVTQAEGCGYAITPESHAAAAAGGSGSLTIATSPGCPWTASSNVSWLTLSQGAGTGPGAMSFSVAATNGTARTGIAVIAGVTFTVSQGAGCTFAVDPLSHTVGAGGGTVAIGVTSASGCQWTASSNVPWITLSGAATAIGNGVVNFTVEAATGAARSASVDVAGKPVTISQTAAAPTPACSFTVSPETLSSPAAGRTAQISVGTSAGCGWTAASSVPWIQVASGSGSGPAEVAITVAANTDGARSGALSIAGRTVTVNQDGQGCSYSLSATSQSLPAAGGTGSVAVTTGSTCAWTATSNAPWLSITGGASTTGSGAVAFAAAAEQSGVPRTGTLTVAGQTFTVTQSGACSYAIAPEQQSVDAAGATVDVAVTAPAGCAWTTSSSVPWLALRSNGPESGNGSVQVTVAANEGIARTGVATIAGRTFTVNQGAPACTYTVKPLEFNVNANDRAVRIQVVALPTCTWTAVSDVPWIRVTSGADGSGEGDVWIYILENTGPDRSGTLTIAGQTVTVAQRGN